MADPADIFVRSVNQTGRIVRNVKPDQWGESTPCPEWSVRDLVNHTVIGVEQFGNAVTGEGFDMAAYGKDVVGDDPVAAYDRAAERLCEALSRPGVLDQPWVMTSGPTPGTMAVNIGIIELQQHGWDIATATGQSPDFDADVVDAAQGAAEQMLPQYPRSPEGFAEEVEPDADASPADRLAAYLGRRS